MSYNGYYVTFPRLRRGFDSLHPHHVVARLSFVSPAVVRFTSCPVMSACGLGTTPFTRTTLWHDFRSSHLRWSGSLRARSCRPAASERLPSPAPRCGTTFVRLTCGGPVHFVPGHVGLRPRNDSLHPHHVVARLSFVSPAVVRFTSCPVMSACGLGTTPSTRTTLWHEFRLLH